MVHLTQPSNSINLILELEKRNFLFGVALSFSLYFILLPLRKYNVLWQLLFPDKRGTAYRTRQKCFAIYLLIGWRRTFITYAERHFCNT